MGTAVLAAAGVLVLALGVYAYRTFNPKGAFFDSNGVRIHYFSAGQGTPVILVHGLGLNGALNWKFPRVFQRLVRRYHVIVMDCRGHGRSGKPYDSKAYGVEMVEDVVRLMDHLKIDKAHVIGYSMGGFITLKLIAAHPERLLTAAPCGAGWAANVEKELPFLHEVADSLDAGRGFIPLLYRLQTVGKPTSPLLAWTTNLAMMATNDRRAMSALLRGMKDLQASQEALRNNTVPCLAVIGALDPLKEFADQMAAEMANLEYVVTPKADHMTALRRRSSFDAIYAFLARHTPSGQAELQTAD